MTKWSLKIARVWGIPIRIHASMLLLIPLLHWELGSINAFALIVGAFTAIVLHELGHSYVAIRNGCIVQEILIMPIGGVAMMESVPRKPVAEFIMALAGPAVSLSLFALLVYGGRLLPLPPFGFIGGKARNIAELLGWINLAVVVFNLIPAFPMDGGRMLRAALTPRLGRLGATIIAASAGRIISLLFIPIAVYTHIWTLAIVGVLIFVSAKRELQSVIIQEQRQAFWSAYEHAEQESLRNAESDVVIQPPTYGEDDEQHAKVNRIKT